MASYGYPLRPNLQFTTLKASIPTLSMLNPNPSPNPNQLTNTCPLPGTAQPIIHNTPDARLFAQRLIPALQSSCSTIPGKVVTKKEPTASLPTAPIPVDAIRHLLHEQNIKKRRLARKAELARLSRRRKKMRLTDLEQENSVLRDEMSKLEEARKRDLETIVQLQREIESRDSLTLPMGHLGKPRSIGSEMLHQSHLGKPRSISEPMLHQSHLGKPRSISEPMLHQSHLGKPCSISEPMLHQSMPLLRKRRADTDPPNQPPAKRILPFTSDQSDGSLSSGSISSGSISPFTLSPVLKAQSMPVALGGPISSQQSPDLDWPMQHLLSVLREQVATTNTHPPAQPTKAFTTLQLSFLRWIFNQKEPFYQDSQGLWNSLFVQELACTPSQMQQLDIVRQRVRTSISTTIELDALMKQLRTALGNETHACWSELASTLTPMQISTLGSWVQRFGGVCLKINL